MTLLLIWLCGVVDRVRGDDYDLAFNNRITDKLTYGWLISALLGHPFDWLTIGIVAGFLPGISIGWGCAIGSAVRGITPEQDQAAAINPRPYPWWMVGWQRQHAYLALFVRGFITGLPLLPLVYWDWRVIAVALVYMLTFPLAIALAVGVAKIVKRRADYSWIWGQQELIRGWLSGCLIALLRWQI